MPSWWNEEKPILFKEKEKITEKVTHQNFIHNPKNYKSEKIVFQDQNNDDQMFFKKERNFKRTEKF